MLSNIKFATDSAVMLSNIRLATATDLFLVVVHGFLPSVQMLLPLGGSEVAQLGIIVGTIICLTDLLAVSRTWLPTIRTFLQAPEDEEERDEEKED